jgi:hypothetical protein
VLYKCSSDSRSCVTVTPELQITVPCSASGAYLPGQGGVSGLPRLPVVIAGLISFSRIYISPLFEFTQCKLPFDAPRSTHLVKVASVDALPELFAWPDAKSAFANLLSLCECPISRLHSLGDGLASTRVFHPQTTPEAQVTCYLVLCIMSLRSFPVPIHSTGTYGSSVRKTKRRAKAAPPINLRRQNPLYT